jgi:oxidase EvaA
MESNNNVEESFFFSSIQMINKFHSNDEFKEWFKQHCKPEEFIVEQMPLSKLEKWHIAEDRSRIYHESGKFFSIEGIHTETNFNGNHKWDQPIINQPEIGILGFITKLFDGVRYFLMQVKMEPGNINMLQISPTVQATKSNFTQVHTGKRPTYLEFFNGEKKVKILVDQLQSEQGGRFFQKRNRNIVVETDEQIELQDNFCWLTLGELKLLLRDNNILNMDSRSVLSTIPIIEDHVVEWFRKDVSMVNDINFSQVGKEYFKSYVSDYSLHTITELISWYTEQKVKYDTSVSPKPLSKLEGWHFNENEIFNNNNFFSVIGVKVSAGSREVSHWMQPLIKDDNIGLLAFIIKKINGVIHFLVQAKIEPGNRDIIELSPTISCSNYKHRMETAQDQPFMLCEAFNKNNKIHFDTLQSEEGGRFYKIQNRNMIVEICPDNDIEVPDNYIWMTLRQMKEFMRHGMFNIEARSIISTINFVL